MPIYNFGVGTLIGRRNGVDFTGTAIANPTPARFGVVQDVEVDFDRTLKELTGQYQFPVDIAGAQVKITGKAKFADIQARVWNDMFFGLTVAAATGEQDAIDESIASIAGTYTAAKTVYIHDLGVRYQATGIVFTRVASGPATGQYSVNESTGVYTFAAGDAGVAALVSYSYAPASTTLSEIVVTNQLMGISPSFEIHLQSNYPNSVSNVSNTFNLVLNACKSSKLTMPLKNVDYQIADFEFMAFADASNTIGKITFTQ